MDLSAFWDLFLAIAAFLLVFGLSLRVPSLRDSLRQRQSRDWWIDLLGLFVQGWLVPLAKIFGLAALLRWLLPATQGTWELPSVLSFLLAFVGVDYLYYWNHRLLHTRQAWDLHRLHHSAQHLDLFASARNSLVTPMFLVYLWVHSLMAYCLSDPTPYVLGATLTACLDLWRHSPGLDYQGPWKQGIERIFITPKDHAWHHSNKGMKANFGANLKIWDQLHGTYQTPSLVKTYGWQDTSSLTRQLFIPWLKRGDLHHV